MAYIPIGIQIEKSDEGKIQCLACDFYIVDKTFFVDELGYQMCEKCITSYINSLEFESEELAKRNCRITRKLPEYDGESECQCTPSAYETDGRESNAFDDYLTKCRHECTNYDDLIANLQRNSHAVCDAIEYLAIRNRTDRILMYKIKETQPNVACSWWKDDFDLCD